MERSVLEELMNRKLCGIETAFPAKVTEVASDGSVSVVALIKKVTVDGIVDTENLVMSGIRPLVVGNGNTCVDIELEKGSQVLLVSLSRHAREWLNTSSDDAVTPKSSLGNTLNDLVAVPLTRCDRKNGQNSRIALGVDGNVEITSKYGQKLKFESDGSITFNPKSGSKVKTSGDLEVGGKIKAVGDIETSGGDVKGNDFKTATLSFVTHTHVVPGVTPGTGTTNTNVPL